MKNAIPPVIRKEYKLPQQLTEFQLSMYIHLIEWKWKNITKKPGVHAGTEYDAILPPELIDELYPLHRPIVEEIRSSYELKWHRHFSHMASSQAACINLFMPILLDENAANEIFPKINPMFGRLATGKLTNGFQFEYWHESNPLNDHNKATGTDSDLAISYYDIHGKLALWLIEHKLTEAEFTTCGGYRSNGNGARSNCEDGSKILDNPSKCYYQYKCDYKYWQIMRRSEIYDWDALKGRSKCPFMGGENQLWRNQLMAEAIKNTTEYDTAHLSVVRHEGNTDLTRTIEKYKHFLRHDDNSFTEFTSKQLVIEASKVKRPGIQKWVEWISDLYRIN